MTPNFSNELYIETKDEAIRRYFHRQHFQSCHVSQFIQLPTCKVSMIKLSLMLHFYADFTVFRDMDCFILYVQYLV